MYKIIFLFILLIPRLSLADELSLDETYSITFEQAGSFSASVIHDEKDYFMPALIISHRAESGDQDLYAEVKFQKYDDTRKDTEIDSAIRDIVKSQCTELANTSIENKAVVNPLSGTSSGFYCSITNKSTEPKDPLGPATYRNMTWVAFNDGPLAYMAVIFSDSTSDPLFKEFMQLLSSVRMIKKPNGSP